jgi:hypothetical protein
MMSVWHHAIAPLQTLFGELKAVFLQIGHGLELLQAQMLLQLPLLLPPHQVAEVKLINFFFNLSILI